MPALTSEPGVVARGAAGGDERASTSLGEDPLTLPVLVINRVYLPIGVITARRALRLLYTGTAAALGDDGVLSDFARWRTLPVREGIDDGLPIVNGCLRVPRIIHLQRYGRVHRPAIRLTRHNLMLRDEHRCQYCGCRAPHHQLNIDHVIPRSRGGVDCWENLVTACQRCNRRKGQRTPREASMPLLRHPGRPRWSVTTQLLRNEQRRFKEWEPFLETG